MGASLQNLTLKKLIILVLIGFMYAIILLSTFELGWAIVQNVLSPPVLILTSDELVDILGLFLLVLVAIELLDTIQVYLSDEEVHAEVVIEAAMIAVARKVILLDLKGTPPLALIALGLIILALAAGYYVLRLTHGRMVRHHPAKVEQVPGS